MSKICSVKGCGNPAKARGLCNKHWDRWRRHGDPLGGGAFRAGKGSRSICSVAGCNNQVEAHGLCPKHLRKKEKYGTPLGGKEINRTGLAKKFKREYSSWNAMRNRCYNEYSSSYVRYGGRGIKVCDRWLGYYGFENFLEDMGIKPKNGSLERIDNNGNYEAGNCRWATPTEQANNRRSNVMLTRNGETHSMKDWCRILGMKYGTVYARRKAGWPENRLFIPPAR